MNFRSKHIADSVTERIAAIVESGAGAVPAENKGAASIQIQRGEGGDLLVTKTFEHGEPELMTISSNAATASIPAGFTDITPADQGAAPDQQLLTGVDQGGIVEAAALGGDSLNALLRN